MSRQYETVTIDDHQCATFSKNGIEFEIPFLENEQAMQDKIDQVLITSSMNTFGSVALRDDVYVNQQIVRQDYSINTTEGAEILLELSSRFPEYSELNRSETNVVGAYEGYRQPYTNPSISWYAFGYKPSEALQASYSASYLDSNLRDWYGLKFDLTTEDVLFKAVINEYDGNTPELPNNIGVFYGITHSQDGSMSDWIDSYIYASPKSVWEFCSANNLDYPLPPTTHTDCDVVWLWGFVFNKNTLEYGPVKAYARYNQEAS